MKEALIAYKGIVTLEKATWDNLWGMYATFTLDLNGKNPFQKFTQMRKGRVGTIFGSIFNSVKDASTAWEDEVMLKGWSDGTSGNKVTFWVAGDVKHPFMDFDKGEEFAVVLVEMDDASQPINQKKRERVEQSKGRKATLSNYAAMLCRTKEFHDYLGWTYALELEEWRDEPDMERVAAWWMYKKLGITSRAELDKDSGVAALFHTDIRQPYAAWTGGEHV